MDRTSLEILIDSGLTQRQIADMMGTSQTNVRYWLRKYDLKTTLGPHGAGRRPSTEYRCKCGERDPEKFYGRKNTTCGKCHNEYTRQVGQQNRDRAIRLLGGQCEDCGYSNHPSALDIHHTDPTMKDPSFRSMRYWAWERIENELKTCILLCKNCHAMRHNTPSGTSLGVGRLVWDQDMAGSTPAYPTADTLLTEDRQRGKVKQN